MPIESFHACVPYLESASIGRSRFTNPVSSRPVKVFSEKSCVLKAPLWWWWWWWLLLLPPTGKPSAGPLDVGLKRRCLGTDAARDSDLPSPFMAPLPPAPLSCGGWCSTCVRGHWDATVVGE